MATKAARLSPTKESLRFESESIEANVAEAQGKATKY
ncbi:uncharacterized protein G2W53_021548 [Senna tora]|uniref:Uncharacterized protein n=1 Tax=Senna tora TaxID=362788 RepID=A0A834TLJ6_9FABA|nr:uncharacterized protein G2W53_021548 [Senna tora]